MECEPISGTFYRASSLLVGYDCLVFLIKVGGEGDGNEMRLSMQRFFFSPTWSFGLDT